MKFILAWQIENHPFLLYCTGGTWGENRNNAILYSKNNADKRVEDVKKHLKEAKLEGDTFFVEKVEE